MNIDRHKRIISCNNKCPFEGFCFPGICYFAKAGLKNMKKKHERLPVSELLFEEKLRFKNYLRRLEMDRKFQIKHAANNAFLPYYYGDNEERARLCEAFRQGALWHDNYVKKNKHEPAKEEIEEVSKNYSSYEYGNEGENYLTAGEFGQIENAFRKGAHWAAEHNKDSKL